MGVCDVDHVVAVYESTDENDPSVDKLTFVSGLGLNTNAVIGEKIVGKDSRAIAQLVTRDSATQVGYVYLNGNKFQTGESVTCLLYTSPSPRDRQKSRMPSSA